MSMNWRCNHLENWRALKNSMIPPSDFEWKFISMEIRFAFGCQRKREYKRPAQTYNPHSATRELLCNFCYVFVDPGLWHLKWISCETFKCSMNYASQAAILPREMLQKLWLAKNWYVNAPTKMEECLPLISYADCLFDCTLNVHEGAH